MSIFGIIGLAAFVLLIAVASALAFVVSQNRTKPPRLSEADARKFAELLVAEIKLSNLRKVTEGLARRNLYEVFQKEIRKARRTYKDRVGDPEQFRYFEDALINVLADSNKQNLGREYFRDFG